MKTKSYKFLSVCVTILIVLTILPGCKHDEDAPTGSGTSVSIVISETKNSDGENLILDFNEDENLRPDTGKEDSRDDFSGGNDKLNSQNQVTSSHDQQTGSSGQKFPGRATDLKGRTITFALGYMAPNEADEMGRRAKKLYQDIERRFNCKIVFDLNITDNQMSASIMSGHPKADIWMAADHTKYINQYVGKLIQPLSNLQVVDFNDTTKYSAATQLGNINGVYYGISPLTYGVTGGSAWVYNVLFFNQSILSQAGYSADAMYALQKNGNWTWDKFEEIAKKVTSGSVYAINDSDLYFYNGLLASNGAAWVEQQGGKLKFTGGNDKNQEVLRFYTGLVRDGLMRVEPDNNISLKDMTEFNAGNTAFYAHPIWAVQHRINNISAFKWGILAMPKSPSAKDYVGDSSWVSLYTIPRGVTKPNEPLTIIDEIMSNPLFSEAENEAQYRAFYAPLIKDKGSLDTIMMLRSKERQSWFGAMTGIQLDFGQSYSWYPKVAEIANGASLKSVIDSVSSQYNTLLEDIFVKK